MRPAVGTISNIANLAQEHVSVSPDLYMSAVLGLLKAVVDGNHVDQALQQEAPDYVSAITDSLRTLNWHDLTTSTGATRDQFDTIARHMSKGRRVVILAGQELLRSARGYHACLNLLDLLLLLGKLTAPGCGFAPLAEENNDQGAVEMGAVAELLPGPYDLADQEARKKLSRSWNGSIPTTAPATLTDMIDLAKTGRLKSLIVVGENPIASLPPSLEAKEALQRLEFLVCQELFLTETATMAHVVLPAASSMEKAGTFTNTEGQVQAVRPTIEPVGDSRPDWEILSALSVLLGAQLDYADHKDLLKEIRSIIPGYGSLGPAPASPKVAQGTLGRYLAGGYRQDLPSRYTLPPQSKESGGLFRLQLVQSLFHSGKLSTRAKGLMQIEGTGSARMNPQDGARLGLNGGDRVTISNGRGRFSTAVTLAERVPPGSVWYPDSFAQEALCLFESTIAPQTKVPSFRSALVSISKAG
jgi:formate dehydrogenase alpha subunit